MYGCEMRETQRSMAQRRAGLQGGRRDARGSRDGWSDGPDADVRRPGLKQSGGRMGDSEKSRGLEERYWRVWEISVTHRTLW
jgi:hypothetical protein